MTTNSTSHLRSFAKGALLVSAAFPLSALIVAESANAEQTVEVNAAETAASVQAKFDAAKATPDRDIKITITSKGEVSGPGTIGRSGFVSSKAGSKAANPAGPKVVAAWGGAPTDSPHNVQVPRITAAPHRLQACCVILSPC